jgi:hypothetical protein
MAKPVQTLPQDNAHGEWTPCWSAHAYGFDGSWWRENTLDGRDCRCPAEKIAHNREQGREIMARLAKKDPLGAVQAIPFALPEKRNG